MPGRLGYGMGISQHALMAASAGGATDAYAANGFSPDVVADFANEYYRTGGSDTDFDTMFGTPTRSSLATMYNSSGELVYCPHNLALNSASPATQGITTVVGDDYTVYCTGTGSLTLSGAGTGSASAGSPVTITASTTTLTLTLVGSLDTMWVNREPGDGTYVATSGSIVYLPRRGAYTYNGTSWVNSGINLETEARTNLITASEDFAATHAELGQIVDPVAQDATDPWGNANSATTMVDDNSGGTGDVRLRYTTGVSTSTTYTYSVYAKANGCDWLIIRVNNFTTPINDNSSFDLSTGALGTIGIGQTATIEDIGGGWYRCAVTFTTDAVDASGDVQLRLGDADDNSTVDLDGNSSAFVYGAQFEVGDTPSSYIPTNGATVARAADDVLTIPTAQLDYPATSGGVSFHVKALDTFAIRTNNLGSAGKGGTSNLIYWAFDANNFLSMGINDGRNPGWRRENSVGGDSMTSDEISAYYPNPSVPNQPISQAYRFTATEAYQSPDGIAAVGENTGMTSLPSLSPEDLEIGKTLNGHYTKLVQWNVDIGDDGIEEAST